MLSKPSYKINVFSPLNLSDKQITETKISHKVSQYQRSTSSKANTSFENYRKPVSLSFNLGRIKPKTISHDKEALYEQNLKLKEQIKYLNDEVVRLRTRANVSELQAYKVIQASYTDLSKSNSNNNIESASNLSSNIAIVKQRKPKLSWMYLQSQNTLRQEVKKLKQQMQQLQKQNEKQRKSIKYTEISEVTIQNERISAECLRLRKLLQTLTQKGLKQSRIHEKQNESMKAELQKLKQNNKFLSNQLKIKSQHVEVYEQEVKKMKQREIFLLEEIKLKQQLLSLQGVENRNGSKNREMKRVGQDKQKIENQDVHIQLKKQKTLPIQTLKQQIKQVPEQNQIIFHHKNRKQPQHHKTDGQITTKKQQQQQQQKCRQQWKEQIKQLLTYRFQNQRYTYQDLVRDVKQLHVQDFIYEQLVALFKSQPFLLCQQYLECMLGCMGCRTNGGKIGVDFLLGKIREFVPDFVLIDEKKQQSYLLKWYHILKQHQKSLRLQSRLQKFFSKQQFQSILIQTQIKREEIQMLVGEAAMVSNSLQAIDLGALLDKIVNQPII